MSQEERLKRLDELVTERDGLTRENERLREALRDAAELLTPLDGTAPSDRAVSTATAVVIAALAEEQA